jgi:hypothetical protein
MTSQTISILRSEGPTLSDTLHDICVSIEAIGGYATLLVDGTVTFNSGDFVTVESRRGHRQVKLPLHGPMATALKGQRPDRIDLIVEEVNAGRPFSLTTSGLKQVIEDLFKINFLQFYIKGEAILRDKLGDDWNWGDKWRFGWAIRNATAHNGLIHFSNPNKPSVQWDGLKFDHSSNGHPVFDTDIGAADLILLMIDMDLELKEGALPKPVDLKDD